MGQVVRPQAREQKLPTSAAEDRLQYAEVPAPRKGGLAATAVAFGVAQSRALLLGTAAVAVSLAAAVVSIGTTGLGASAGVSVAAVAAVPALTGALVLSATTVARWRRADKRAAQPADKRQRFEERAKPLLSSSEERRPPQPQSSLPSSEPDDRPLHERIPDLGVVQGEPDARLAQRSEFFAKAQKRAASWVSALVQGAELTVNDEPCEVRLSEDRGSLLVGDGALPLVSLGFRMHPQKLELVAAPETGDLSEEHSFLVAFHEGERDALEFAMALKILRAAADSGQGVGSWSERPSDSLRRPKPAE